MRSSGREARVLEPFVWSRSRSSPRVSFRPGSLTLCVPERPPPLAGAARRAMFDTSDSRRHHSRLEANGSWWAPRSSKPSWGVKSLLGVFDSHAPPPYAWFERSPARAGGRSLSRARCRCAQRRPRDGGDCVEVRQPSLNRPRGGCILAFARHRTPPTWHGDGWDQGPKPPDARQWVGCCTCSGIASGSRYSSAWSSFSHSPRRRPRTRRSTSCTRAGPLPWGPAMRLCPATFRIPTRRLSRTPRRLATTPSRSQTRHTAGPSATGSRRRPSPNRQPRGSARPRTERLGRPRDSSTTPGTSSAASRPPIRCTSGRSAMAV